MSIGWKVCGVGLGCLLVALDCTGQLASLFQRIGRLVLGIERTSFLLAIFAGIS